MICANRENPRHRPVCEQSNSQPRNSTVSGISVLFYDPMIAAFAGDAISASFTLTTFGVRELDIGYPDVNGHNNGLRRETSYARAESSSAERRCPWGRAIRAPESQGSRSPQSMRPAAHPPSAAKPAPRSSTTHFEGKRTVNALPWCCALSTVMVPPTISTSRRQIARPSPHPLPRS